MNLIEGTAFILLETDPGVISAGHGTDQGADLIAGLAADHVAGPEADPAADLAAGFFRRS